MSMKALLFLLVLSCTGGVAQAQTATDDNEGLRVVKNASTGASVVSWWGRKTNVGPRSYFIQQSDDLINWTYVPAVDSGEDAVISYGFTSTAKSQFFRLQYADLWTGGLSAADADFDNDGLSNIAEITLYHTDPFNPDTDVDGFQDSLEIQYGTDPNSALSFPNTVTATVPATNSYLSGSHNFPINTGDVQFYDDAVLIYMTAPLPSTMTSVQSSFITRILDDTGNNTLNEPVTGRTLILPGRQVVAFIPQQGFAQGANNTYNNNYALDFTTATTGIPHLMPWHQQFSTVKEVSDTVGPWVQQVLPGENYVNVDPNFIPTVRWSQPLDPATVLASNVSWVNSDTGVAVDFTLGFEYLNNTNQQTNTMTVVPAAALAPDSPYTITFGTGLQNLTGKPLQNAFVWNFRTRPIRAQPLAGQGPYVQDIYPADFSTGVNLSNQITIYFSEAMDVSTLTASTVVLQSSDGTMVPCDVSCHSSGYSLIMTPTALLDSATQYVVTLSMSEIQSAAATPKTLQGNATFTFTTMRVDTSGNIIVNPDDDGSGTGGTPDPSLPPPVKLHLNYGEYSGATDNTPDTDAGATVTLKATLPDGSVRQQKLGASTFQPMDIDTPEYPGGTTFEFTPEFQKGSDPDVSEEQKEIYVTGTPSPGYESAMANYIGLVAAADGTGTPQVVANGGAVTAWVDPSLYGTLTSTPTKNSPAQKGKFVEPEFKLRNAADIEKGWDDTGKEPWTSVGVGKTNSLVKLVGDINGYELAVDDDSTSYLSVGNETTTNGEKTFTITGIADSNNLGSNGAKILYRETATKTTKATIHVHVLPQRAVNINVYLASDNRIPQSQVTSTPPSIGAISDELNSTYNDQANIYFTALSSSSTVINNCYDPVSGVGGFASDGNLYTYAVHGAGIPDYEYITGKAGTGNIMRIFVVNSIVAGSYDKNNQFVQSFPLGFTNYGDPISFIKASADIVVYPHEVGHALGLTSLALPAGDHHEADGTKGPNDSKPLMLRTGGSHWIRQQDWRKANTQAGNGNYGP